MAGAARRQSRAAATREAISGISNPTTLRAIADHQRSIGNRAGARAASEKADAEERRYTRTRRKRSAARRAKAAVSARGRKKAAPRGRKSKTVARTY